MKKILTLILCLIISVLLISCNSNKKKQDYLNAIVKEINETNILAECIDESTENLTGTLISVSKNVISTNGIPNMEIGSEIRVVFDFGDVNKLDSPIKIEKVYAIYLVDENGEIISH